MATRKPGSPRKRSSQKKRQPRAYCRPSAADFRAGAAKLDILNSMAPRRQAPPPVCYLSSDSELSDQDMNTLPPSNLFSGAYSIQTQRQQAKRGGAGSSCARQSGSQAGHHNTAATSRRRLVVEDSEDEGTSLVSSCGMSSTTNYQGIKNIRGSDNNPTQRHTVSPKNNSSDKRDYLKRGARAVIPNSDDDDDLEIDMIGWDTIPKLAAPSQGQSQRYFTRGERTRTTSLNKEDPSATQPPLTLKNNRSEQRYSHILDDASPSASITLARPSYATPQTLDSSSIKVAEQTALLQSYDKRLDPDYDAIRDPTHEIHRGCDFALQSVEEAYARQERAAMRERRR